MQLEFKEKKHFISQRIVLFFSLFYFLLAMAKKTSPQHLHCMKCRKRTSSHSASHHITVKGGSMLKAKCVDCGTTKCRMVKKGAGFFDTLKDLGMTVVNNAKADPLGTALKVAPLLL